MRPMRLLAGSGPSACRWDAGGDPVDIRLGGMSAVRQRGLDDLPGSAIAGDRDRAKLVGAQERQARAPKQADRFGVGVPVVVILAQAGHGQLGSDRLKPTCVGAISAAVMGKLENGAVAHQVGIMFQPPLPLGLFAVPRQKHREAAVFHPQPDRIVVFLLAIVGRLREDRRARSSPARSCEAERSARSPSLSRLRRSSRVSSRARSYGPIGWRESSAVSWLGQPRPCRRSGRYDDG